MIIQKRTMLFLAAFAVFLSLAAFPAAGAMGDIQSFTFNGYGPEDAIGPGEDPTPDGNPDAVFSTTITGAGVIAHFTISSPDGNPRWDTRAGNSVAGIRVKDGKGEVITSGGGSLRLFLHSGRLLYSFGTRRRSNCPGRQIHPYRPLHRRLGAALGRNTPHCKG